jgi:hypothetical protein
MLDSFFFNTTEEFWLPLKAVQKIKTHIPPTGLLLSREVLWNISNAVDTVVYAPDDGWKYHPKHLEQFLDINKLCKVASCWIFIGILLGAHPILHISRIRVNWKNRN